MESTQAEAPPLSVGYISPGWPQDAFANGVVAYIADMADQLRRTGHQVTILASRMVGPKPDASIYDLHQVLSSRGWGHRMQDRLESRIAPRWASYRANRRMLCQMVGRAVAERGIQLVEIEEAFGHSRGIRRRIAIPVCVRLHGPWFLN